MTAACWRRGPATVHGTGVPRFVGGSWGTSRCPLDASHVTVHTRGDVTGHTMVRHRPTGAVSIRDVAAAAGVSHQTVSRVINGHPSVRASTRESVLAAIGELGFRPNRAARALAGGPVEARTVLTRSTGRHRDSAGLPGIGE